MSEVNLTFQCHFKVVSFKMDAIWETTGRIAKISLIWTQRVYADLVTYIPNLLSKINLTFQGHLKVMSFKMVAILETGGRLVVEQK